MSNMPGPYLRLINAGRSQATDILGVTGGTALRPFSGNMPLPPLLPPKPVKGTAGSGHCKQITQNLLTYLTQGPQDLLPGLLVSWAT